MFCFICYTKCIRYTPMGWNRRWRDEWNMQPYQLNKRKPINERVKAKQCAHPLNSIALWHSKCENWLRLEWKRYMTKREGDRKSWITRFCASYLYLRSIPFSPGFVHAPLLLCLQYLPETPKTCMVWSRTTYNVHNVYMMMNFFMVIFYRWK